MLYEFDWSEFTERDLMSLNRKIKSKQIKNVEDDIYGFIIVTNEKRTYIVDVHYYYYSAKNQGFDLEVYKSSHELTHNSWIDGISDIHSATDYNRFCKRAENLIIALIRE